MIELIGIDQDWQNAQTIYWFNVNSVMYGLADQCNSFSLLDSEGYPIDECNDHGRIKDMLLFEYEKIV